MTLEPLHIDLDDETTVAAVVTPGDAAFSLVLLHEHGGDLDAVLPLLADSAIDGARSIAVDLPGHGLSSGSDDVEGGTESLSAWLSRLEVRDWGPFVVVAVGRSAAIAWRLARNAEVAGLCLIAPRLGGAVLEPLPRSMPMLLFSTKNMGDVGAIRAVARGPWMSASMQVAEEALVQLEDSVRGQVASHLKGFALEVCAGSPALCGQVAEQPSEDGRRIPSP